jgi:hypothetical protein
MFLFRSLCQDGRASLSGISDPLESSDLDLLKYGWQVSLTLDELQEVLVGFSATQCLFVSMTRENQNKHRL